MKVIYALGNSKTVFLFQSIGIEAFLVTNEKAFNEKLKELTNAKIIIVAETLAPFLSDSQKYEKETYPIILFLPMEGKESGLGLEQLKKDVEKAIGIALLR